MTKQESITFDTKRKKNYMTFYSPSFMLDIMDTTLISNAGKGTHISLYAESLEGENNAHLNWPFIDKIKIMLLNQEGDQEKIMNIASTLSNTPH